jgi:hypothetical protein
LKKSQQKEEKEIFDIYTGDFIELNSEEKRELFSERFEKAYAEYNEEINRIDDREKQYFGTKEVKKSVNNKNNVKPTDVDIVPNLVYELLEAERDTTIPSASVKSRRSNKENQQAMVQNLLKFVEEEADLEKMQDETEQVTYLHGQALVEPVWDEKITYKDGFVKVNTIHPKSFIPQPGIFSIEDMDYFFIAKNITKEKIKRIYGKSINSGLTRPEITSMNYTTQSDELITVLTAYYKNYDNTIGRFVWCDNGEILEDTENIYSRYVMKCTDCKDDDGTDLIFPLNTHKCPKCDKELKKIKLDYEVLKRDVVVGKKNIEDPTTGQKTKEDIVVPAGSKIKLFDPKRYPIVQRINVPKSFWFGGQSDVDILDDKQNSLKKTAQKIDEKIIKSGSIVTYPKNMQKEFNNGTYSLLAIDSPDQINQIQVKNIQAEINQEIAYVEQLRKWGQQSLGITNSFLGENDSTAISGKAKQVQIAQSSGRLGSKIANKYQFYKELYRQIFYTILVFSEDPITMNVEEEKDGENMVMFDKYKLLVPCEDPNSDCDYEFDASYIIKAENVADFSNDPTFLYQITMSMVQANVINARQGLKVLDKLGFPLAKTILQEAEDEAEQIMQNQSSNIQSKGIELTDEDLANVVNNLDENTKQQFLNMSDEEKTNIIGQVTGLVN